jgi:hypothetical protein
VVLGLCDRWHKLPSEVLAEPADPLVRLLAIENLGTSRDSEWEVDDVGQ